MHVPEPATHHDLGDRKQTVGKWRHFKDTCKDNLQLQ